MTCCNNFLVSLVPFSLFPNSNVPDPLVPNLWYSDSLPHKCLSSSVALLKLVLMLKSLVVVSKG